MLILHCALHAFADDVDGELNKGAPSGVIVERVQGFTENESSIRGTIAQKAHKPSEVEPKRGEDKWNDPSEVIPLSLPLFSLSFLSLSSSTSHSHTHTHSLSLVLVAVMKPKEPKTKIYSHAHPLCLPGFYLTPSVNLSLSLYTHLHTLYTLEIKGNQELEIYFHADSLILSCF